MGLLKNLKELVGIEEIDEVSEEEVSRELKDLKSSGNSFEQQKPEGEREQKGFMQRGEIKASLKTQGIGSTNPFRLVVIEPRGFEDCPRLVDNLKARKPVIINLENLEQDIARKIFDFLSGATYALNGNVQKGANDIFVFAPENVDIAGNMENKGLDFDGNPKSSWR